MSPIAPPVRHSYANIVHGVGDVFIDFLRSFFTEHPEYPWDEQSTKTKIVIQGCEPVEISRITNHPAIFVDVGPVELRGASIDQLSSWKWLDKKRPEVMVKQHADLMSGNMAFHVLSREGLEARAIAFILLIALTTNRPYFRVRKIFDVSLPRMIADSSVGDDLSISSIAVQYLTQIKWEHVPSQGPLLRRFMIEAA